MTKDDMLAYLAEQMKRTQEVYVVENNLVRRQEAYNEAKRKWKKTIILLVVLGVLGKAWSFLVLAGILWFIKHKKVTQATQDLNDAREKLDTAKARAEYREGLEGFPKKFYDYVSVSRLFNLVNESRANTLQDAYNILENQLQNEYQNNLAEQNLRAVQAAEKNARIAAFSSSVSAINSFRK